MITLGFTGDIGFSKYFKGAYQREDFMSDAVIDFLADTDYTVANVEGAVSKIASTATKKLVHANDPDMIPWVKKINGTIWNLANNHTNDCGPQGVYDTLENATIHNCLTVGLGKNITEAEQPVCLQKEDVTVGMVAVCFSGEDEAKADTPGCVMWNDNTRIKKQIEEVKKDNCWCVVIAHAGVEFAQMPFPYIRNQYKKYLQYGADIVVGHHPHVVQNYETFGDKSIFYSLGNFVFDTDYQRMQRYSENGMLIKIHFTEDDYYWEQLPIKIDRTTQTIDKSECPAIFCNINKWQYALLWPLAARDYYRNWRVANVFFNPEHADFSEKEWLKLERKESYQKAVTAKEKRSKETRFATLIGRKLAYLSLWRLSDKKDIIEYLK